MADILAFLGGLPDKRRGQGMRYTQDKTILLMLIGVMAGCQGYRSVARFCKLHEGYLSKVLGLKHGVPSHVSLTAIIEGVDLESFESSLIAWSRSKLNQGSAPLSISVDGKSIRSSVQTGQSCQQNFVAVVHAFCASQGLVVGSKSYESKQVHETNVARQLIEMLGIKGAVLTLDAAHASKKQ